MKKILYSLMIVSLLSLTSNLANAQAWQKSTKIFALGMGVSQFYHQDDYYRPDSRNNHSWYSPITYQINLQAEFGIHKYVGIGFTLGTGTRNGSSHGYITEVNIPIGMIANFHFYQLIADKSTRNIHADKLDIYFGANVGSGVAIYNYSDFTRIIPIAFGGAHAGVRYFFTKRIGVNCEVGMGKSLVNAGFVFSL
jgi:hypothetical protein